MVRAGPGGRAGGHEAQAAAAGGLGRRARGEGAGGHVTPHPEPAGRGSGAWTPVPRARGTRAAGSRTPLARRATSSFATIFWALAALKL